MKHFKQLSKTKKIVGGVAVGLVALTTMGAGINYAEYGQFTTPEDEAVAATPTTDEGATTTATPTTTEKVEAPTTTLAPPPPTTSVPAPETTPATVAPTTTPPPPGQAITITDYVDGDTVDISTGERIRLLGYDTPERGECGYDDATNALRFMTASGTITMTTDTGDDTDRYGRILRHVLVDGEPVGLLMIQSGNANARYDSLDGYPRHVYQDEYRAADGPNGFVCSTPAATPPPAAPAAPANVAPAPPVAAPPVATNNGPFKNCDAVRAAGRAPIRVGEPGFESKFDRDNDGVGCE